MVTAALLAAPPGAMAVVDPGATFTVNSVGDADDTNPGDGVCSTGGTACSLRAAITEANADTVSDTINFTPVLFDGGANPNSTLALAGLPAITKPVTIDGGNCGSAAVPKPCVGLTRTPAGASVLDVQAANVTIRGVAFVAGATDAILGTSGAGLAVRGAWFGLNLDQTLASGFVGSAVHLTGSSGAAIGGTTPAGRNVIVHTGGVKIETNDNHVLGNYLGVGPDGSTAANLQNIEDIAIFAATPPTGNVIGGPDPGTPGVCDGPCNVLVDVSNNARFAIRLDGDPVAQTAGQTTIAGNFIGMGLDGSDQGLPLDSIFVGDAPNVTIGGPTAASRNYVGASGDDGIDARSGAANLDVLNNFIGLTPDGHAGLPIVDNGVFVGADGAEIRNNRFAGVLSGIANKPQRGLWLDADDAQVSGNVFGVGTGGENLGFLSGAVAVRVDGDGNVIGGTSPGDANTIGHSDVGVFIASVDGTEILGNFIGTDALGADLGGGLFDGVVVLPPTADTVIGGPTAAGQNVMSNVNRQPIFAAGGDHQRLTIGRNLGIDNGQNPSGGVPMFVDIFTDGLGMGGANSDLAPPQIAAGATSEAISGTAPAGAKVLIYVTPDPLGTLPVNLSSFVAEATANASGNWSFTCPSAACPVEPHGPGGLTANSTDAVGDSSEFPQPVSFAAVPPETTIDSGPAAGTTTADSTVTFNFSANEAGSTFECRIDADAFAACSGPGAAHTTPVLADGSHSVEVRATDPGGHTDASPASRGFTVDTTPPDTQIESGPTAGSTTADSVPTFGFSATEPGSTFECRLDGAAFAACRGPGAAHTPAPLANGPHTFEVRATDPVGNVDPSPAARTFTVDTDPPETRIDKAPKNTLKVKKTAKVTYAFSSDEPGSTFRCSLDGKPQTPCSSPLTIRKLKKGKHTFSVAAVDAAGNPDPTPATDTFKVKRKRKRRRG